MKDRNSLVRWVLAVVFGCGAVFLSAQTEDLIYLKQTSREATERASLEAMTQRLTTYKAGPWQVLGPAKPVFAANGATDLQATFRTSDGATLKWTDGSRLADGQWQAVDPSIAWLYRVIEAERDQEVTLYVSSKRPVAIRFNAGPLSAGLGPPGWLAGQLANINEKVAFTAHLKRGANYLSVQFSEPTAFYFEISPVSAAARARLEERLAADFPGSGEDFFYRLETVPVPAGIVLEVGGMSFMPDGALMICTRRGEIWSLKENHWTQFASGLQEPLGLWPGKVGEVFVVQRSELTRVVDTDGDGRADVFQTINADCGVSASQHAYIFGPVRDRDGNFWGAISALGTGGSGKYFGWSFKVTPQGEFVPWSTGLRSPNGLVITPDGDLFIADNQGEYVGTSPLHHVTKGAFHGYPLGLKWDPTFAGDPEKTPIAELAKRRKPAAVLFPYGSMGQSLSQPVIDLTAGKFGPFAGQMFIGDQTKSIVMRVALEKVDGEFQGACFPFRSGFQSGNNRLAFAPDGSLYAGQTDRGWGSVGGRSCGLQRLVWTGRVALEIYAVKLTRTGFELQFTTAIDPATAGNPANYSLQRYHYLYHASYGSPQVDHTPVAIQGIRISSDGRTVWLTVPELVTGRIYELHLDGVRGASGDELLHRVAYYTLNRLLK